MERLVAGVGGRRGEAGGLPRFPQGRERRGVIGVEGMVVFGQGAGEGLWGDQGRAMWEGVGVSVGVVRGGGSYEGGWREKVRGGGYGCGIGECSCCCGACEEGVAILWKEGRGVNGGRDCVWVLKARYGAIHHPS